MKIDLSNSSKTDKVEFYQQKSFFIVMIVLAVLGGYAVTSYIFLRNPQWLHKKKKCKFSATHISHRGGAAENLENTMTAFNHALAHGTDMLEIDVHMTADETVVVSHDNCLKRTTGSDILVSETKFKDLPLLKPSLSLDFDKGHVTTGADDRRIVRLRDVFEKFPDTPINIDIKIDNDRLCQRVNDLIVEFHREEITVWGNKSKVITDKLYKLNPKVPLLFCIKRVLVVLALYYTGLLPFVPIKESFYEILMPYVILKRAQRFGRGMRALFHVVDFLLMRKTMFRHLQDRGIQVYLWVLNDEEDFHRGFKYGVDGIMTDFPTKLSCFLEQNAQYCRRK